MKTEVLCSYVNPPPSVAAPMAPPPLAAEPVPTLPEWIAPLLLAGLVAVSGVIVLGGWLIMKPSPRQQPVAAAPGWSAAAPTTPPVVSEIIPITQDEPLVIEDAAPRATILLRRRMPSPPDEPGFAPMPIEMPAPVPEDNGLRLIAPLRWVKEPARSGEVNLIMPIEIARIEDGRIPYTVRRLQFDGPAPERLKLAVTPCMHDDLGSLLTKMGEGYRFTKIRNDELLSLDALRKHDVVFLTCADMYVQDFQAAGPLRRFVQQGGTLYASDLRGDLVLAAFPEFRARMPIMPGVPQNIEASVLDKGMQSYLGRKSIPLSFEAPDWRPAAFDPSKVTVCLKGMYRNNLGQAWPVPLLVKFRFGKGTVIFTSFHHAKNDTEIVRKLLDYLVFATVNARSEARVKELMQRSQFAPQEMRPVVMTADTPFDAIYKHAGGGLQIALGFENLGAKLKLTLCSPTGQTIEHEGQGVYQLEVPKAEAGRWQYTVTPLELPYANFPILVAIGGVKS